MSRGRAQAKAACDRDTAWRNACYRLAPPQGLRANLPGQRRVVSEGLSGCFCL